MEDEKDLCAACNGTGLQDNFTLCPVCGGTPSKAARDAMKNDPTAVPEPVEPATEADSGATPEMSEPAPETTEPVPEPDVNASKSSKS